MATSLKIADNEMNYFQYKAHQMLLLKKEDCEWKDFCKQIAPECAACSAEKFDSKDSKDIGVQAFPLKTDVKTVFKPKSQNDKLPEALENIKIRLEKIDLALSKLNDLSCENKEVMKSANSSMLHNEKVLKSFEEQKKLLIQNSLKASLQKLHSSSPSVLRKKPPPAIKQKNSGYFLPHDLHVKRAAARKAYLLSLQTKPKVTFRNVTQSSKKNVQTSEEKKNVPKYTSKPKKKATSNKGTQESNVDKEETLIAAIESEDAKDENIEQVIDGILEDLLGETALDLNKIRQRKLQRGYYTQTNEAHVNKEEETAIPISLLSSALTKITEPKALANDASNSITKLKDFFGSPKKAEQMSINLKKEELMDASTFPFEDSKNSYNQIAAEKRDNSTLHKTFYDVRNPPKFECSVSNVITVDPEKAKNILLNKERFERYLKKISQTVKGAFNPWILNEVLSEAILDECINDIAGELNEMSSNFIQYLYNQEFVQKVVD